MSPAAVMKNTMTMGTYPIWKLVRADFPVFRYPVHPKVSLSGRECRGKVVHDIPLASQLVSHLAPAALEMTLENGRQPGQQVTTTWGTNRTQRFLKNLSRCF